MRTLLKYAKIWQSAKYVDSAYSRFSDMSKLHCTSLLQEFSYHASDVMDPIICGLRPSKLSNPLL